MEYFFTSLFGVFYLFIVLSFSVKNIFNIKIHNELTNVLNISMDKIHNYKQKMTDYARKVSYTKASDFMHSIFSYCIKKYFSVKDINEYNIYQSNNHDIVKIHFKDIDIFYFVGSSIDVDYQINKYFAYLAKHIVYYSFLNILYVYPNFCLNSFINVYKSNEYLYSLEIKKLENVLPAVNQLKEVLLY